ncbi:MAG: hypothetical protein U0271_18190 [Polyangiaceae bacterium]
MNVSGLGIWRALVCVGGLSLVGSVGLVGCGDSGEGSGGDGGDAGTGSEIDACTPEDDANSCTIDTCVDGDTSHELAPVGFLCLQDGEANYCDGSGSCVQCIEPKHCPGPESACRVRTCEANTCGFENLAAGTLTSDQKPGDCHAIVCDDAGETTTIVDNDDVPVDHNDCTADHCEGGVPTHANELANKPCGAGNNTFCDGNGQCVGCVVAEDCGAPLPNECMARSCSESGFCGLSFLPANTPVAEQTDGDCVKRVCDGTGNIITINDDADAPASAAVCGAMLCVEGVPTAGAAPDGTACDDANACTLDDQCQDLVCAGATPVACVPVDACHVAGVCDPATGCAVGDPITCQPVDQCHVAGECDPATGCANPAAPDGTACDDGDATCSGDTCQAGVCAAGTTCAPQ